MVEELTSILTGYPVQSWQVLRRCWTSLLLRNSDPIFHVVGDKVQKGCREINNLLVGKSFGFQLPVEAFGDSAVAVAEERGSGGFGIDSKH